MVIVNTVWHLGKDIGIVQVCVMKSGQENIPTKLSSTLIDRYCYYCGCFFFHGGIYFCLEGKEIREKQIG